MQAAKNLAIIFSHQRVMYIALKANDHDVFVITRDNNDVVNVAIITGEDHDVAMIVSG